MDDFVNAAFSQSDLTGKIVGCAPAVHKALGNGFQEVVCQRALAIELTLQGLQFARELEMEIRYQGREIGARRVDFFVSDLVMVELKAVA